MESSDVNVDVPAATTEEANQSPQTQSKAEPRGMLKSPSATARFQVAPVSAGNFYIFFSCLFAVYYARVMNDE